MYICTTYVESTRLLKSSNFGTFILGFYCVDIPTWTHLIWISNSYYMYCYNSLFCALFRGRKKRSGGGGGRWVVSDVGDTNGPIDGSLLMYRSEQSGDYHGEFNGEK